MKSVKDILEAENQLEFSPEDLAQMGGPKLVYIREVLASDLADQVEGLDDLPADAKLFSVHLADGTPMALLDEREAAFEAAREFEYDPVSVH